VFIFSSCLIKYLLRISVYEEDIRALDSCDLGVKAKMKVIPFYSFIGSQIRN
jgi:hypothetical protein